MQVISGRTIKPPRVVLYAKDGMGKTTWAAGADRPIFLPTEEGADEVGCDRFPLLEDFPAFLKALAQVAKDEHDYGTVVVDSLTCLERLIWASVSQEYGVSNIEEVLKGFGKGYIIAVDRWRRVLAGLDMCRARGMAVILIAHAQIKRFDSPETDPFDRYGLRIQERAAALVREWADVVGYATDDIVVKKADVGFNASVARGHSTGKRSLRLVERPAYDAKNRYGLPDSIPFPKEGGWQIFCQAFEKAASKASVRAIVESAESNSAEAQKEEASNG